MCVIRVQVIPKKYFYIGLLCINWKYNYVGLIRHICDLNMQMNCNDFAINNEKV